MALTVKDLRVSIGGKEILGMVSFKVDRGEVVALMGPNGSGKSTLAYTLMGHPAYSVIRDQQSAISLDGEDLLDKTPDERARLGLFLALQYPVAISGVTVREALLASLRARQKPLPGLPLRKGEEKNITALEVKKRIEEAAKELGVSEDLLKRGLNEGFSGGEKKKMEVLQMRILEPKYAVLDETDSGLDIDALKLIAESAAGLARERNIGILVITHYQRLLKYLKPDRVLVMKKGRIVEEGGAKLVDKLEKKGYGEIRED